MSDMSQVIVPKSDQWNADDFIAGPQTFTIRDVKIKGGEEQPVDIMLEGTNKAFRPCKSMSRCLVTAWGADAKKYIGRSMTLYRDPTVKWGGLEVGGIRISHLSDIDGPKNMMLTATRGSRKPHNVMPLERTATDPKPGSIITEDDFRKQLDEAAKQGTKALELVYKDRKMAPLREHIRPAELESWKAIAADADLRAQPQPQEAGNGGYEGP